jgi:hypothetical protein
VKIVDDEEKGSALREADHCGCDGDEHARLLVLGSWVGRRGRVGIVLEQALDHRRVPGESRILASQTLEAREEGRRERQIREVEMLPATARAHLHAAPRRRALHLTYEARLSDAGLAGDQDELRVPGAGVIQALLEPLALLVSVDERANSRRLLPDQPLPPTRSAPREG